MLVRKLEWLSRDSCKETRIVVQGQLVESAVCFSYGPDKLNL